MKEVTLCYIFLSPPNILWNILYIIFIEKRIEAFYIILRKLDIKFKLAFPQTKFWISPPQTVPSLFLPFEISPSFQLFKPRIKMWFLIISFPRLSYAILYKFSELCLLSHRLFLFSKPLTCLDPISTIASQILS